MWIAKYPDPEVWADRRLMVHWLANTDDVGMLWRVEELLVKRGAQNVVLAGMVARHARLDAVARAASVD